jgi:hypothetical protein
MFAYCE